MSNKLQWGQKWNPTIPHSNDWECPTCNWRSPTGLKIAEYVVGFDESCPMVRDKEDKIVVIIECPKDFTKFWFHNFTENCEFIKNKFPEKFKDADVKPENLEGRKMR